MSEHCRFSEHEQKPFSSDSRASIFKVTGYCSENQKHSGKWQMFTYTWELKFCLVSFAWEQSWPDSDQTKTWERKCVYWSNKQGHLEKCVHNSILVFVLVSKLVASHLYATMKPLKAWYVTHREFCTAQRQSCVFRSEGGSGGEQHRAEDGLERR